MITRHTLGGRMSFGAFAPTHRADQVEAALRGFFPPEQLTQLGKLVAKAGDRRVRQRKSPGELHPLADLLEQASRPPSTPVAMRWYSAVEGGEPLRCVLVDGVTAGEIVTTVPPGVQFRFADPAAVGDQVFCQPVDDQGSDLGARAWGLDSEGRTCSAGRGTYLVPFDAIRTGDGSDAR